MQPALAHLVVAVPYLFVKLVDDLLDEAVEAEVLDVVSEAFSLEVASVVHEVCDWVFVSPVLDELDEEHPVNIITKTINTPMIVFFILVLLYKFALNYVSICLILNLDTA